MRRMIYPLVLTCALALPTLAQAKHPRKHHRKAVAAVVTPRVVTPAAVVAAVPAVPAVAVLAAVVAGSPTPAPYVWTFTVTQFGQTTTYKVPAGSDGVCPLAYPDPNTTKQALSIPAGRTFAQVFSSNQQLALAANEIPIDPDLGVPIYAYYKDIPLAAPGMASNPCAASTLG